MITIGGIKLLPLIGGKYQNEGGPGPREIARRLSSAMAPRVADEAIWRFFDALAWNWLIGGTDAHAKNYSLLMAGAQVRLAPLYDIASAFPYDTHERRLRLAMKVGGDYRLTPYRNPWPAAARELNLDVDRALERVRPLVDAAPAAFADAASDPAVAQLGPPLSSRLVDLVAERAGRCSKLLDGSSLLTPPS